MIVYPVKFGPLARLVGWLAWRLSAAVIVGLGVATFWLAK